MKKLVLKTALITFGVTLVLAVSLFGIVSFCAPAMMMRFCESLGLDNIGGDYAYQEYQNTKQLDYLAHSFEVAAENGSFVVAEDRFEEFYGEEGSARRQEFSDYCTLQNTLSLGDSIPEEISSYDYRRIVCGIASRVKYHLAQTDDQKSAVCAFAIEESPAALTAESPVFALALEAIGERNGAFCQMLSERLSAEGKFDKSNEHYQNLIKFLEI